MIFRIITMTGVNASVLKRHATEHYNNLTN